MNLQMFISIIQLNSLNMAISNTLCQKEQNLHTF